MTSILNKGPPSSGDSEHASSKKCFFCWTVLKQFDTDRSIYLCPEKHLNNCKKYLNPKFLESHFAEKDDCDKIIQETELCLTCHESSEKLDIVNDVLESVQQELRDLVAFFNSHISHSRDENADKEYILGDVDSPIDTTFDSDNEGNYCPSDNSEVDKCDISNEQTGRVEKKKLKADSLTCGLQVCLERIDGGGDRTSNCTKSPSKQKLLRRSTGYPSLSKIEESSPPPKKILPIVDSNEGTESFIDNTIDIKYELIEETYEEDCDSVFINTKQELVPSFHKEIQIILTRLSPKYINSQCALSSKQRNLGFVKRKAARNATAAIVNLTNNHPKNTYYSKDDGNVDSDPDFVLDENADMSNEIEVPKVRGEKKRKICGSKLFRKSTCSSMSNDKPKRKRIRTDVKRKRLALKSREGFIYPCSICEQKFNYHYKLRMHMRKEHPDVVDETYSYTIKCKKCGRKFMNSVALKHHEIKKHGNEDDDEEEVTEVPNEYPCSLCDKTYQHPCGLRRHMLDHNRKRVYECEHCEKSFTQRVKWIAHQKQHIEEFNFPCDLCELKFKQKIDLKDHKRVHQKHDFLRDNDKGTHYQCGVCNQSFKKEDASFFSDHMFFHLNEHPFKCKLCEQRFSTKVFLKKHHEEEHGDCFPCGICGSKLKTHQSLSVHMKSVHVKENLICEICGLSYNSKLHLRKHVASHRPRTLNCDQCDKTFATRDKLTRHINMVHKRSLVAFCDICGKRFGSKSQKFRIHMRTHTDEKPFQCSVCNEKFISKDKLQFHMRKSHEVGKIECKECGKTFNRQPNFALHMRTHTGEKPYECSVCQKRFDRKHNLTTHMRFHTGEKPYKCNFCGNQFARKDNLNTHLRKCPRNNMAESDEEYQ